MISLTFIILILLLIINTIIAYCPEEPDIDGHLEITTTIINNGGYENCDCSQDIKSVTFASDVTTVPVDMFKSCKTLERVLIHSAMTNIDTSAFANTGYLSVAIVAGDTFLSISEQAFENSKLHSIYIPRRVNAIGNDAFTGVSEFNVYYGSKVYLTDVIPVTGNYPGLFFGGRPAQVKR